ncbi:hypothetical protein FACS189447_07960 [Spirochaetia bacterium]|nr:hypothetical protein FACS189447_07960 [Spirochaetia bacterium]
MNLIQRAAADARKILENENGAGTSFILSTKENEQYPVTGSYGDIGYLLNPQTGEAIQGRTIQAAYSMKSLREQTEREPEIGWRFTCFDLSGEQTDLFITRYEPDRTIGVARLRLALNLHE